MGAKAGRPSRADDQAPGMVDLRVLTCSRATSVVSLERKLSALVAMEPELPEMDAWPHAGQATRLRTEMG